MSSFKSGFAVAVIAGILYALCAIAIVGVAHARIVTVPRAVSLSDATVPPTEMVYLYPNARVTYAYGVWGFNCPNQSDWFTDVSAYKWDGSALGVQHHSQTANYFDYWVRPGHPKQRVTFDGITFRNGMKVGALVAGWCDA